MTEPFQINPFDPAFVADPFPTYARGRAEQPVYRHPGFPVLSAFRYADIVPVLKDAELWSSRAPVDTRRNEQEDASMLGQDPPIHTRLRGLVNQAFTPRMIRQLEPRIRAVAADLIDEALGKPELDIVEALSIPLPVVMIAELIGVPAEDHARFKDWSDKIAANLGEGLPGMPLDPEREKLREAASDAMDDYFTVLAQRRRDDPRDDLLSGLVRAEVEGEKLSQREMLSMLALLLIAGNETTTNLISNTILQLDAHPEAQAALRADPSLVPSAIEEVLRFDGPVQATFRAATRDTEVGGMKIAQGEMLFTWLGSANRDPAEFPDGERFDITRAPGRHMTFGLGVHFCLGANLARLEGRVALEELLRRTRGFERLNHDAPPRNPSFVLRGPRRLAVRLSAA